MILRIGSSSLQYYHLPVHHSGGQISAILPFSVSSVCLKPRAGNQTALCSLFIWMADFAGLSPLSSDIVAGILRKRYSPLPHEY